MRDFLYVQLTQNLACMIYFNRVLNPMVVSTEMKLHKKLYHSVKIIYLSIWLVDHFYVCICCLLSREFCILQYSIDREHCLMLIIWDDNKRMELGHSNLTLICIGDQPVLYELMVDDCTIYLRFIHKERGLLINMGFISNRSLSCYFLLVISGCTLIVVIIHFVS